MIKNHPEGNQAKCLDNLDIWLIVNMIEVGVGVWFDKMNPAVK